MDRTLPKDDARSKLPEREGVETFRTESAPLDAPGRLAYSLQELAGAFALCNPGLLFSVGGVDRDPIADYWIRSGLPMAERPCLHELDFAPFAGFQSRGRPEDPPWDRCVMLVRNDHAPGLFDYLRALSVIDWRHRRFWRTEPHVHMIAGRPGDRRTLPVTVFDVYRDDASYTAAMNERNGRCTVLRMPAAPSVVLFAESLFGQSETPFRAVEPKSLGSPGVGAARVEAFLGETD